MKFVVVQFKDGTKKVVPRRWVYAKEVAIHKKYPIFFCKNISKMAPEDPAMLQRYQRGEKSGYLHTVNVLCVTDTLGEATQKLFKRIAVKPTKIQTDSDEVISQLLLKNPKKDNKKMQHSAAKHQNEIYLSEFLSANSSATDTNLMVDRSMDPLGINKSMAPTSPTPSEEQYGRTSTPEPHPVSTSDSDTPEQSRRHHRSPKLSIGSNIIKDATIKLGKSTKLGKYVYESNISLSRRDSDTLRQEENCPTSRHKLHAKNRWEFTPIRRTSLLVTRETSQRTSILPSLSSSYQSKRAGPEAGPSPYEESLGEMATQMSITSTSESSLSSVPCTPGQSRQHHDSKKPSTGSDKSIQAKTKHGKHVGANNISRSRHDDDNFSAEIYPTSQHSQNYWTPLRRTSLLVTQTETQLLIDTAMVETAKRQNSRPDNRLKSTPPPVADGSSQMRFRAEITDEVFVPETESETGNCKNCEVLQKRLEKAEAKNHVLTELNLNLQMEKVKLLARNNEKAPFVNKVADLLSPEIVLRIHMESAAGSDGDGRFISGLADHLWSKQQIIERSVKGKNCNLHPKSGCKQSATPSKVSFIVEKLTQRVDLEGDLEPKRKIPSRVSRKLNEKMSNARRKRLDL